MSIAKEYESITMKSENIVSALKETAQSTIPPKSRLYPWNMEERRCPKWVSWSASKPSKEHT